MHHKIITSFAQKVTPLVVWSYIHFQIDLSVIQAILMIISANFPIVESGEIVTAATVPPKLFAFSAIETKVFVSPEPEPMINKSPFSKLLLQFHTTT